jgi:predicted metal-dependent phosphotriesterase family hydrolase
MATTVETALGPIVTTELGPTLMHEHIVTRSPGVQENGPHLRDRPEILKIACGVGSWGGQRPSWHLMSR